MSSTSRATSATASDPAGDSRYPDEYFPRPLTLNLRQVNELYQKLLFGNRASTSRFVRVALSRRFSRREFDHPDQDRMVEIGNLAADSEPLGPNANVTLTGDWDSLISKSRTFPYAKPFSIYSVPPFRETLTKTNHLKGMAYSLLDAEVRGYCSFAKIHEHVNHDNFTFYIYHLITF